MNSETLITMNIGSSSLRCGVFDLEGEGPVARRLFSIRGLPKKMIAETSDLRTGATEEVVLDHPDMQVSHEAALKKTLTWLDDQPEADRIAAFAHRIVHGGPNHGDPVLLDDTILEELDNLAPLAPSHQLHNLRPVHRLRDRYPDARQVGCFDTAFHRTQPRLAQLFALPRHLSDRGLLRYGFHGLSYAFIADKLEKDFSHLARGRVIVAHLGHGVSMCALEKGRSIATTMGLTALDGLPMGQRCGALDPGVVLHLIMELGYDAAEVRDMLYEESGLLGVSGLSGEMGDLVSNETDHAREAVDLFAYRCGQTFGSLAATLGGVDGVVLTGGMGTHQPAIRERLAKELRWLGITFDAEANKRGDTVLSGRDSRAPLLLVATDEEAVMARNAAALLRS
jgi:acetate kinase